MLVGEHGVPERLGPVHGAPDVRSADPEHLPRCVLIEAGQPGLWTRGAPPVRAVRQLHATVVGDVLSNGAQPVDAQAAGRGESVVLPDHASRPVRVLPARFRAPPRSHVARLVVETALIVEPVRDLVPDHVPDAAVVHVVGPVAREEHPLQYP